VVPAQRSGHSRRPREWLLWQRPKRFIAFLLVGEAIAITVLITATAYSPRPDLTDVVRFLILAAGATIHIQLTRRQEARRRNRGLRGVLIDLTAVWIFPAALVLPIPLIIALVALVRAQRWFSARRPAHNFLFSSISHALAASTAHLAYTALGPRDWGLLDGWQFVVEFGLIVVAALVYEAVQIVYVGSIIALNSARPTMQSSLGTKADNVLEAVTIGLGAVTAILLVIMPPTVAIMAVVTVVFNRLAELDQLQSDVRTDPKTGLLNMRGWTESAQRTFRRAVRSEAGLAVLMIDFDHFKEINDTYGHPAGDDVLRRVAELLTEVTRPGDVVGRFGGEEFLVLVSDVDALQAYHTAERIRHRVSTAAISTRGKRGEPVTITDRTTSIGVAVYPQHGRSIDELLHAADAAVYLAKEQGRDQVRLAGETPFRARH
jgi:diguanylate cyclase (GGDEF)-like protein